jgi:hypothetical protein
MLSNNLIKRDTTGAFALIDSLVRHKVKHIFGYPGGAILPIYDELYAWEQEGFIEHILVRHEQGAAHASDAYSNACIPPMNRFADGPLLFPLPASALLGQHIRNKYNWELG